jgi:hypothetical protein
MGVAMDQLIEKFAKEWALISSAPLSFCIAVVLVGGAVWWIIDRLYKSTTDGQKAQIGAQAERISLASDQLKESQRLRELAERDVKSLQEQIAKMAASTAPVTPQDVEALAFSSSNALTVLDNLSTSNTQIGTTLDPTKWGQAKWGSGKWAITVQDPQFFPTTKRDP